MRKWRLNGVSKQDGGFERWESPLSKSSIDNYDEFYPDVSWYEGVSNEYYQLSEELPKGLDFMVIRYLNDYPAYLWRFLAAQKNPEEFIKKIHSKLLRNTVEKLWHEEA